MEFCIEKRRKNYIIVDIGLTTVWIDEDMKSIGRVGIQ